MASLSEINQIQQRILEQIDEQFPEDYKVKVEVSYPDSPNPSVFFEVNGDKVFLQVHFWSDQTVRLDVLDIENTKMVVEEHGNFTTVDSIDIHIQKVMKAVRVILGKSQ